MMDLPRLSPVAYPASVAKAQGCGYKAAILSPPASAGLAGATVGTMLGWTLGMAVFTVVLAAGRGAERPVATW